MSGETRFKKIINPTAFSSGILSAFPIELIMGFWTRGGLHQGLGFRPPPPPPPIHGAMEAKLKETKLKLENSGKFRSHISSVEFNNSRNFPRSGMGNKNKIK